MGHGPTHLHSSELSVLCLSFFFVIQVPDLEVCIYFFTDISPIGRVIALSIMDYCTTGCTNAKPGKNA